MAIFLLVFTLLMAFLAITLLLGIAPISSKAKSRTMYVSATLMILITVMTCDYIDMQTDIKAKIRFHAVLIFAIAVGYFCIAVAYMEKYNIVKLRRSPYCKRTGKSFHSIERAKRKAKSTSARRT